MPSVNTSGRLDAPSATGAATRAAAESGAVSRAVGIWLAVCAAMVFAMVVVGGATRLTESGLSMTDWRPVTGWLPPMSAAEWQAAFDGYRASPEFQKLNFWMTLGDYKTIFWLEYLHRLWGRLIGIAFAVPLAWFWLRGRVRGRLAWQLAGLLALGAAQGALGWYMVKSGLVDRPEVSQYRLAAHLILAVAIYAALLWLALRTLVPRPAGRGKALRGGTLALIAWAATTVIWGALVAGIDAGLAYNTFPLMDGRVIPRGIFVLEPWWANFGENTATVQFTHRILGIGLATGAVLLALRARTAQIPDMARTATSVLALATLAQMGLGIATLLSVVALPLGVAHQAGALVVVSILVWTFYALGEPAPHLPAAARAPARPR